MNKELGKVIAVDGLSLAGKSTTIAMINERAQRSVVIVENRFDPFRPTTSRLNSVLKTATNLPEAFQQAAAEVANHKSVLDEALAYATKEGNWRNSLAAQKQAALAYMFTRGRAEVDKEVMREIAEGKDVLLDRWYLTGCAYQVSEDGLYTPEDIRTLNQRFGITVPHTQLVLACNVVDIPTRRSLRAKIGTGTAGQMSEGREDIILPAFQQMHEVLKAEGANIHWIENPGTPVDSFKEQIRQAIPAYLQVEQVLREGGFRLRSDDVSDPEAFWLTPERLERIYFRQTGQQLPQK